MTDYDDEPDWCTWCDGIGDYQWHDEPLCPHCHGTGIEPEENR
ncbi:hypothetical protein [Acidipropionibacterium timonense]|nr:hypothetical protein [Acidipropionibacterium timonense]